MRPAEDGDDAKEAVTGSGEGEGEGKSAYHVFATNVSPEAEGSDPDRFAEMYRRPGG